MVGSKRGAQKSIDEPAAKRATKPRAARLQDDPVWSTTNAKSHLVEENLHSLYSNPATYEGWTKEDWDEVRDCFPDDVPLNSDGYSVSLDYLKYDTEWRRHIREFQEDLGAGRYDSQWQEDAAEAMQERACGKFDSFKEEEFEAFWGQKQKADHDARAGEGSKVKLDELLGAGVLRKGDELSFRRHFARDRGDLLVEKEMKILEVDGPNLTVAIPPAQMRFARVKTEQTEKQEHHMEEDSDRHQRSSNNIETKTNGLKGSLGSSEEDVIVVTSTTLKNIADHCLDTDGRIASKDAPPASAWRAMRVKRNNQDLGSMFEIRDEYFVNMDATTVKTPKKKK